MNIFKIKYLIGFAALVALNACQSAEGNKTGSEFVPDMAHSIAVEANVYHDYGLNNFDETSVVKKSKDVHRGLPVKGTVARGYAGNANGSISENVATAGSGSVPYYYNDTEEERTRAMAEITSNPYAISKKGLANGKELYDIYCASCHGKKADGLGYLVADENPNAKYPAAPANFLLPEFVSATEGRYYHAIMYGKNVMGSHADKLGYEERWNVIHYIRSLQAKDGGLVYNSEENTLNNAATPAGKVIMHSEDDHGHSEEMHTDDHDAHGHDAEGAHGHGDGHDHGGDDHGHSH